MSDYIKRQHSYHLTTCECKCRRLLSTVLLVGGHEQDKICTTLCHRTFKHISVSEMVYLANHWRTSVRAASVVPCW